MNSGPFVEINFPQIQESSQKLVDTINGILNDQALLDKLGPDAKARLEKFKITSQNMSNGDINIATLRDFQNSYKAIANSDLYNQSSSYISSFITTTIYDPYKGGAAYTALAQFKPLVASIEKAMGPMAHNDEINSTANVSTAQDDMSAIQRELQKKFQM